MYRNCDFFSVRADIVIIPFVIFLPASKVCESLGLEKVRVLLKPDAIPTIFERPSSLKRKCELSSSGEPAAKKKREQHMKSGNELGYVVAHNILLYVYHIIYE